MSNVQILKAAITVLQEIYDDQGGDDWLYEVMGQTGGSVIDMLELVAAALVQKE